MASNVGGVGSTQNYYEKYQAAQTKEKEEIPEENENDLTNPVDTYTPSSITAKDQALIDSLWNQTDQAGEALRKMVAKLLGTQDESGQGYWAQRAGDQLKLSDADRAQAQEMVSEDGFFGVKQTTDRIMSFAKALVGDDASGEDIDKMRTAVQKGFDEVSRLFGAYDKLPDVTKQTYESVMKSFDDWKAGKTETE